MSFPNLSEKMKVNNVKTKREKWAFSLYGEIIEAYISSSLSRSAIDTLNLGVHDFPQDEVLVTHTCSIIMIE